MKIDYSRRTFWLPLAVFGVLASLILMVWGYANYQYNEQQSMSSQITADNTAIRIEEYVNLRLAVVDHLRDLFSRNQIQSEADFVEHALAAQDKFSGLLAINWIDPQGIIRWVVPEGPNRAAKGKDLHVHPDAATTFLEAERSGQLQVTGPLNLLQGGRGFAGYFPLDIDGRHAGYLNAVFRVDHMIDDCLSHGLRQMFDLAIYESDQLLYADGEPAQVLAHRWAAGHEVNIGGHRWMLTLAPAEGQTLSSLGLVDLMIVGMGLLFAAALSLAVRKLVQRADDLRNSEERYRTIYENAQVGLFRIRLSDGKLLTANRYMAQLFGYELDELLALPRIDDAGFTLLDRQGVIEQYREQGLLQSNGDQNKIKLQAGSLHGIEITVTLRDGSQVSLRYSLSVYPDLDYCEGVVVDMTEIRRAEAALRQSEEQNRALLNAMPDMIFQFSAKGEFISYKAAKDDMLLLPPEAFMGKRVHQVLPPDVASQTIEHIESALATGQMQIYEYCLDLPNGSIGTFETRMVVSGEDSVLSMVRNVSDRKRAEQQMFRAEKMAALGQIIAGVAHEINNPNNFIFFNLPILERYIEAIRPLLDDCAARQPGLKILNMPYEAFLEDVFKLLQNMQHGSERITSIVSELRSYIRSQEAEELRPEDVNALIEHVMTLVGKQVRKTVKRFDVELEPDLPAVTMNIGRIEQVLINLVINAGQAADKDDSWVRLHTGLAPDDPGFIEFVVTDNGCGIAADVLSQIFDPFFTTKGRESGTGLGLAISQRIVEEHSGRLLVHSDPGEGSRFTVLLPIEGKSR
ncbi:MAG: ATP-binding protein [Candidatus Alcyoniella australis]|nr:ATP-binding protein [Candidatus Alcyoniella australis]